MVETYPDPQPDLGHPFYAPFRPYFRLGAPTRPMLDALAHHAGVRSGGGQAIRFVLAENEGGMAYERRIFDTGQVPTRPGNWHDLFGALAWLRFPQTKAAINRRHVAAMADQADGDPRGPLRDALTQFDECGLIVLTDRPELWAGLRDHRWREVFGDRRAEVLASMRFLVFGHATCDAWRAPYPGLCAKALCLTAETALLDAPVESQALWADARLAGWFEGADPLTPGDWQPMPLLGIPGATPANADPGYYDDIRQFRPRRSGV